VPWAVAARTDYTAGGVLRLAKQAKDVRRNWLSNRIFKSFDDIVDHCCYA